MCEEQTTECPLCMEAFDLDDLNFKPCTCGYQICRFCWHRIRTDENGLCPACRKPYSENPAEFKPLTEDDVGKIKKERKQRDQQRKQKAAENRKHLANVRVVQKNLVFVVGLSARLADPEVLKKPEYFGKFGKIYKVVINQSTAYAGAQGPSASAYVTYKNQDDAIKAILNVNNVHYDGRTLKASLGTTKYCSHFLRGSQCPKADCMYLHELGEEAASFTKEEMQMSKHSEYEQKLIEEYLNTQNADKNSQTAHSKINARKKCPSPEDVPSQPLMQQPPPLGESPPPPPKSASPEELQSSSGSNKDWPSLGGSGGPSSVAPGTGGASSAALASSSSSSKTERLTNGTTHPPPPSSHGIQPDTAPHPHSRPPSKVVGNGRYKTSTDPEPQQQVPQSDGSQELSDLPTPSRGGLPPQTGAPSPNSSSSPKGPSPRELHPQLAGAGLGGHQGHLYRHGGGELMLSQLHQHYPASHASLFDTANNLSLFSNHIVYPKQKISKPVVHVQPELQAPGLTSDLSDTMPVLSRGTDWQAAFGFDSEKEQTETVADDDLGFDPCGESIKELANLVKKEEVGRGHAPLHPGHPHNAQVPQHGGGQQLVGDLRGPLGHFPPVVPGRGPHSIPPGFTMSHIQQQQQMQRHPYDFSLPYSRRLFPVDRFQGAPSHMHEAPHPARDPPDPPPDSYHMKEMQDHLRSLLPNINISFGATSQSSQPASSQQSPHINSAPPSNAHKGCAEPHWMDSIHKLTENDTQAHKDRPPVLMPPYASYGMMNSYWPVPHNAPPGFSSPNRLPQQPHPEPHQISEGLQ